MLDRFDKKQKTELVKPRKRSLVLRFVFFIIKVILLIVLPFLVLIRGAVFLNFSYDFGAWTALFFSLLLCSVLCLFYLYLLYKFIFRKVIRWKTVKIMWLVSLLFISSYCSYSIWYFSVDNAKSPELASEYYSLHPLLRLSISTLLLLDKDALITDFSRTHEDYIGMGKPSLKNSLHYIQENNYVHAMDIRTIGRGEIRNKLLRVYFYLMGFQSLRHNGTADHLHISLAIKSKPGLL